MEIKVNLSGIKEVDEAIENAKRTLDELYKAVGKINNSLNGVGLEISQPPEKPEAE